MLIDTHCHLDAAEFAADRQAVLEAAIAAGVTTLVVPAVSFESCVAVCELAAALPACRPAYGLHPLYLDGLPVDATSRLRDFIAAEMAGPRPPVAIGETGLDHYLPGYDAGRQQAFFLAQLRLAREFDLPVIVHVRRAVDDVLACLRRVRVRGGIAHAFNGSRQQAEQFIGLGFKLGFGGAMTYSGSTRIRRLAAELPLSALVLETDAPDIPPSWCPGGRCEPVFLARYAEELAALRGVDVATVRSVTSRNVVDVLSVAG